MGVTLTIQVSDVTGRMDLSEVARGCPFNQSLLCPDDCFVLDTGSGGKVYVWKGAQGWGWGGHRATPCSTDSSIHRA